MASSISQEERIERYREIVRKYEPYPLSVLENAALDDETYNESNKRYVATVCLDMLLSYGFSEDEVNPWKK